MSARDELTRPSRRIRNAIDQIEIGIEDLDVDDEDLKESLRDEVDRLESIEREARRREGGSA